MFIYRQSLMYVPIFFFKRVHICKYIVFRHFKMFGKRENVNIVSE